MLALGYALKSLDLHDKTPRGHAKQLASSQHWAGLALGDLAVGGSSEIACDDRACVRVDVQDAGSAGGSDQGKSCIASVRGSSMAGENGLSHKGPYLRLAIGALFLGGHTGHTECCHCNAEV